MVAVQGMMGPMEGGRAAPPEAANVVCGKRNGSADIDGGVSGAQTLNTTTYSLGSPDTRATEGVKE